MCIGAISRDPTSEAHRVKYCTSVCHLVSQVIILGLSYPDVYTAGVFHMHTEMVIVHR